MLVGPCADAKEQDKARRNTLPHTARRVVIGEFRKCHRSFLEGFFLFVFVLGLLAANLDFAARGSMT